MFADAKLDETVILPQTTRQACARVESIHDPRPGGTTDTLRGQLAKANIGSEIYYPVPLHRQQCFEPLGYQVGSLPETERAASEVLSLPIYPELTEAQQATVVDEIGRYYTHRGGQRREREQSGLRVSSVRPSHRRDQDGQHAQQDAEKQRRVTDGQALSPECGQRARGDRRGVQSLCHTEEAQEHKGQQAAAECGRQGHRDLAGAE